MTPYSVLNRVGRAKRWIRAIPVLLLFPLKVAFGASSELGTSEEWFVGQKLWFLADLALEDGAIGRTDGLVFAVEVREPGSEKAIRVLERPVETAGWHPVAVDLSPWAGREIWLRLVVEPGPRKNARYDFGLWGRARVSAVGREWDGVGTPPSERIWMDLVQEAYQAETGVGSKRTPFDARGRRARGAVFDAHLSPAGRTRSNRNTAGGVEKPAIYHHPGHIGGGVPSWAEFFLSLPLLDEPRSVWMPTTPVGTAGDTVWVRLKSKAVAPGSVPVTFRVLREEEPLGAPAETTLAIPEGVREHRLAWPAIGVAPGPCRFQLLVGEELVAHGEFELSYPIGSPAEDSWPVVPPGGGLFLVFFAGLEDGAFPASDGVEFQVGIRESASPRDAEKLVYRREVREPGWQAAAVDLTEWQGREVILTLRVTPGRRRSARNDWAVWGQPAIVRLERGHPGGRLKPGEGVVLDLLEIVPIATGIGDQEVAFSTPTANARGAVFHPFWSSRGRATRSNHASAGVVRPGIFHHPAYVLRPAPSWAELELNLPTVDPVHVYLVGPGRDAYDRERVPLTPVIVSRGNHGPATLVLRVTPSEGGEPVFEVRRAVDLTEGVTRYPFFWPTLDDPQGNYRVEVTVEGRELAPIASALEIRKRKGPGFLETQDLPVVRMALEAEDFEGDTWTVKSYCETYFSGFGGNFMSGLQCLSAPAEAAVGAARKRVDVPRPGRYRVWARFEAPSHFETRFGIRIRQNGRLVFDEHYGDAGAIKLWNFGTPRAIEQRLAPDVFWPWGGGDNVVWQGHDYEVGLDAGEAEIEIYLRHPGSRAADRNIDAVFLTTEKEIKPKNAWLPFLEELGESRKLAMRFVNPPENRAPIRVSGNILLHRNPFLKRPKALRKQISIEPGGSSTWITIGPYLDTTDESTLQLRVRPETEGVEPYLEIEFAEEAEGPVLERVRWGGEGTLGALALINVPARYPREGTITTGEEVVGELVRQIRNIEFSGRAPESILIYPALWDGNAIGRYSREVVDGLLDLYELLGFNTLNQLAPTSHDLQGRRPMPRDVRLRHFQHLNPERVREERMRGVADEVRIVSLGDEIPLPRMPDYIADGSWQERFRQWLAEDGYTPRELLPPSEFDPGASPEEAWKKVRMVREHEAATYPRLYFHTQRFQGEIFVRVQGEKRRAAEAYYGDDVWVGANFSPHNFYEVPTRKWVQVFQDGGMTMPWTEDYVWQVPEVSVQVVGFAVDALRLGAREKDLPIHFYAMPHTPNNTDRDLRLSAMEAIAHGARVLNYFCAFPKPFWYENFVDAAAVSRYRTIGEINHEIGAAEPILKSARVVPARVGLLFPEATEIWETAGTSSYGDCDRCDSNSLNEERKGLWFALRHLQVEVDPVTSREVERNHIDSLDVIYLVGTHVEDAVASRLAEWVEAGGVLFASGGSGAFNEYGEPSRTMPSLLGYEHREFDRRHRLVRPKMNLRRMESLGRVELDQGAAFETVAFRHRVGVGEGAEVTARFADGEPAVIERRVGKGRTIFTAASVGLAYVRKAIPDRPWDRGCRDESMNHLLPKEFDESAKSLIARPLKVAGVRGRVECSVPLVEASLLNGPDGAVVVLTNFSGVRQERLRLRVRLGWIPSRVESVRKTLVGEVQPSSRMELILNLDDSDILLFRLPES